MMPSPQPPMSTHTPCSAAQTWPGRQRRPDSSQSVVLVAKKQELLRAVAAVSTSMAVLGPRIWKWLFLLGRSIASIQESMAHAQHNSEHTATNRRRDDNT